MQNVIDCYRVKAAVVRLLPIVRKPHKEGMEDCMRLLKERMNIMRRIGYLCCKNPMPSLMDSDIGSKESVQCRICHDEDEDSNMEVPCSCSGSLKYAHHRCVQRWCNEKGDTICEICRQNFKPGYLAPSPLSHYGSVAINLRDSWEVARDLHYNDFMGMVSTNQFFLDSDFDDDIEFSSRRLICCRIVATIFTVLLVLRHTLPIIISCAGEYSATLFMLVILRIIGILLPIYIIVKVFTAIQRHRYHHQDFRNTLHGGSDEENELPLRHPQRQLIRAS